MNGPVASGVDERWQIEGLVDARRERSRQLLADASLLFVVGCVLVVYDVRDGDGSTRRKPGELLRRLRHTDDLVERLQMVALNRGVQRARPIHGSKRHGFRRRCANGPIE